MKEAGDSSYDDSFREASGTADSDHGITQTRTVGTELADEPPAEPMSREEYADYIRQGSAAGIGYDTSGENGTGYTGEPGGSHDTCWSDPADQAQGMAREEYAGYMLRDRGQGQTTTTRATATAQTAPISLAMPGLGPPGVIRADRLRA